MSSNRTKESAKSFLFTIILQLEKIIIGFIIPQLFLRTYGPEIHGLTSSITNILSYLTLVNAGLGTASIQALYAPLGRKDSHETNAVLNAVSRFYRQTGIAYSILVVLMAFILPSVVGNQVESITVIVLMIVMGSSGVLGYILQAEYKVLLQADQKLYVVSVVNVIIMALNSIFQVVLILYKVHIIFVQLVPVATIIVSFVLFRRYVLKNYGYLDRKIAANMKALSKRWSAFTHQIAGLVVNNIPILLLTVCIRDLVLVSIYSVYQLVFRELYLLMTSVFSQATVASFGQLGAVSDYESIKRNYKLYEYAFYMTVSVVYSVSSVMILSFVDLYTISVKGVQYVDEKLAVLFIIVGIANNLRVPGVTMINAYGLYKETQWRAILEAMINFVVSVAMIQIIGIYGVLFGALASFTYRTLDIILYSNARILKQSSKVTLFRALRVIVIVVINLLFFKFVFNLQSSNWMHWFVNATIVGGCSCCLTFAINYIIEPKTAKDIFTMTKAVFLKRRV